MRRVVYLGRRGTYAQIMPILDEYNVELVLYGHNHYLDSTYPIVWTNEIEKTVFESYEYINDYVDYYKVATATTTTKKNVARRRRSGRICVCKRRY